MPASGSKVAGKRGRPAGPKKSPEEGAPKKKKDVKPLKSYSRYIHKCVPRTKKTKKVGDVTKTRSHPDYTFTKKGIAILNSFVLDMFDRLATEASKLAAYAGSKTLRAPHITAAVKLQLPP
eukprot:gene10456-16099_t